MDEYLTMIEKSHQGRPICYVATSGGGISICELGVFGHFPVDQLSHLSGIAATLEADRLNATRLNLTKEQSSIITATTFPNERRARNTR
jgi:hypothetical protein